MRQSVETLLVVFAMLVFSLGITWFLYDVLESVAEGTYLGFRIGGAAAVFIVLFLLQLRAYTALLGKHTVRVLIDFSGGEVPESLDDNAECSYTIYNRGSLKESKPKRAKLLLEAAGPVIYVKSRNYDHLIKVELRVGGDTWKSDYEGLHVTPIRVKQI